MDVTLNLNKAHHVEVVTFQYLVPRRYGIAQPRLGLGTATVALAAAPDACGQELGGLDLVVAVGAEQRQSPMMCQIKGELGMSAQVRRFALSAAVHKRQRMIDLVGVGEAVPAAAAIARCAVGRIPCLGRVECLLNVIDGGKVLLHIAEHTHFDGQEVTEHALVHVHVAGQVAQFIVQDNTLVVHVTQRHAVTRTVSAAHESDMVVLQESGLLDSALPVGVIALVNQHAALGLDRIAVTRGIKHFQVLDNAGDAHAAVISHSGAVRDAFLGHHFDDTRSASRAILCRFTGIF